MIVKKLLLAPSKDERYYMTQEDWDYLEDPTYQPSCGNMVCMTCKKFTYSNHASCGAILCCNLHKKLIFHGEHLTHACELYEKKASFSIIKKLYPFPQEA